MGYVPLSTRNLSEVAVRSLSFAQMAVFFVATKIKKGMIGDGQKKTEFNRILNLDGTKGFQVGMVHGCKVVKLNMIQVVSEKVFGPIFVWTQEKHALIESRKMSRDVLCGG